MVCISKPVLQTALSALNNLRGDSLETNGIINSDSYRFAGYNQYTWWIHSHLGKGIRKVIPSCAIWAIRNTYPSEDGKYIPFMESKEEDKRITEEK